MRSSPLTFEKWMDLLLSDNPSSDYLTNQDSPVKGRKSRWKNPTQLLFYQMLHSLSMPCVCVRNAWYFMRTKTSFGNCFICPLFTGNNLGRLAAIQLPPSSLYAKKTDKAIVFAELDHARKRIGLTQKCVTSFEKLILFSGYLVFPCTSYLWGDHGKTFSFENF